VLMERLYASDMCVMGPGDLNKHKKEGKTSWDTTTYALVMAHNVYNHIQAVQEINRLADIDYATRKDVSYKDWYQIRDKKKNISDFVPNAIIFFNNFVEVLFDPSTKDPYNMLKENEAFLNYVSFGDKKTPTTYGSLWETDDEESGDKDHNPTGEELAGLDKEDLIIIDDEA
jgi:hypothetical protein